MGVRKAMTCRFVSEEEVLFNKWKVFPDVDDSLDSSYEDDMKKLVDETYEVGFVEMNEG